MYLELLKIKRFRSCDDVTINLRPDLTILVGENNGGKSNIIDAVRLLVPHLSGRRERYAEDDDIRRHCPEAEFRIEGHFAALSDTLKGMLVTALPDPSIGTAVFGMKYQKTSPGKNRGRPTFWAGKFESVEPEVGAREAIRHVYLPPLRDAQQALDSGSANRVVALLQHFLQEGEETELISHVRRSSNPHRVVSKINAEISLALDALTSGLRKQHASLGFYDEALTDIARDLRFKLADHGLDLEKIRSSGMGYANLLYIATVIVELSKAKDSDLTLFLVEEPEAHLHPQLQMLVLQFLLDQARLSTKVEPTSVQPEGQIQIIVTTHSPNLTAWVSPNHLVVVRSERLTSGELAHCRTVAVPVAELHLSPETLGKISRYIDVTRAALLFGNRALLVEGMAEALLIPVIAQRIVLKGNRDALLRFRGAVVIPIDGVDFKPYVEILLRRHSGFNICERVVIVTDRDPALQGNRLEDLQELAKAIGSAENLHVFVNRDTLESDLFADGNEALLKDAFLALHPRSGDDWEGRVASQPLDNRPDAFRSLIEAKRTRKGDLAQELARLIDTGRQLKVPQYLVDGITKIAAP